MALTGGPELLPDVVRESGLVSMAGFGLGIVVMFSMRAVTSSLQERTGAEPAGT